MRTTFSEPSKLKKNRGMIRTGITLTGLILILTSLSWGASQRVQVGAAGALNVEAEIEGYSAIKDGKFVFQKGQPIQYRIITKNQGNQSFPTVEMQASLHSNGGDCGNLHLAPGSRLEGNSISALHTSSLSPGRTYIFSSKYQAPRDICSTESHLKVRLQYIKRGIIRATTLVSPAPIIFE